MPQVVVRRARASRFQSRAQQEIQFSLGEQGEKENAKSRGFPFPRCNFVAQFGNKEMKGPRFRVAQSLEPAFNVRDNVVGFL